MDDLLDHPLASAELLAVDCETNGRGGEACELTEVGAVLAGGGELHERWSSLVSVQMPLSRGIERFTGITQAMVDSAPPPERVLPELARRLEGRVLVAHNASFDHRVLEQAFERAGLEWPAPPVLCTVALARRCAPLVLRRGLAPLADALGIEVEHSHRALPDAETCGRVLCALLPRLCAVATTVDEAVELFRGGGRGRGAGRATGRRGTSGRNGAPVRRRPPADRPDLSKLPDDPGVYVFRDDRGRVLYVGKSVSLRSRARSHFCAPAGWTELAEVVDYRPTNSELGALVLENRLIKQWRPPGNTALKRTDRWVYLRCRLDVEYPVLEVGPEPAQGRAISVGPMRGRAAATELSDHLTSLFKLRHCGRRMQRREHPSIYGQMGRCCSPCLGDLDPNAYRRQLDAALGLFEPPGDPADRLLGHIDAELAAASADRRYERAAALLRRRERLESLLGRLSGMLRAVHAQPRLVLAPHPSKPRFDALWIVAGKVADWAPLGGAEPTGDPEALDATGLAPRTASVLERPTSHEIAPEEVDEVRIVSAWLAEHEPPELSLASGVPSGARLERWLGRQQSVGDRLGEGLARL